MTRRSKPAGPKPGGRPGSRGAGGAFGRILVPVDLTRKNTVAVRAARELARPASGRVTLLHVIETLDAPPDELRDFYQRLEAKAREHLDLLARALDQAGIAVDRRIAFGKRVPEIVRQARELKVDLIILASHQLDPDDPVPGFLTISHQVAILAPCPVLMLK
jgi:nucleotide-binding universal stress UspA family protein